MSSDGSTKFGNIFDVALWDNKVAVLVDQNTILVYDLSTSTEVAQAAIKDKPAGKKEDTLPQFWKPVFRARFADATD